MSTIAYVNVPTPLDGPIYVVKWPNLHVGDQGAPLLLGAFADNNVEVEGTVGPGTINIVGTIDPAGTNANILTDQNGNHLAIGAADDRLKQVLQHPYQIWPLVVNGDGTTDVTVFMKIRR